MMGTKDTVLFCISTAGYGKDNQYNKMALARDENGDPLFQLELVQQACNRCQSIGKASTCRHLEILLPAWKDPAGQAIQRAMLDKIYFDTETMGLISTNARPVFSPVMIDYWLSNRQAVLTAEPHFVFVTIDPSRGSNSKSELASLACVRTSDGGCMVRCCCLLLLLLLLLRWRRRLLLFLFLYVFAFTRPEDGHIPVIP